MRRKQIVYILSCLGLGAVGFAIGMTVIPDKWSDSGKKKGEILRVFFFLVEDVEKSVLRSGWSQSEDWGTWSDGPKSTLAIDLDEPHRGDLELEFVIQPFFSGERQSQRVELSVNGIKMDTWMLLPSKQEWSQQVRIPKNIWDAKRPVEVAFVYSEARSPAELGIGKDSRRLAIGLKTLTIRDLF